jgi:hypothetical protein
MNWRTEPPPIARSFIVPGVDGHVEILVFATAPEKKIAFRRISDSGAITDRAEVTGDTYGLAFSPRTGLVRYLGDYPFDLSGNSKPKLDLYWTDLKNRSCHEEVTVSRDAIHFSEQGAEECFYWLEIASSSLELKKRCPSGCG